MDVGLLETLTAILRGGGPFAAFILMIWFLEPRFRAQMQQPHRAAVFIPVYVLNLLIAVLMLFAAIYFWFVQEGVLGDESIQVRGNVSNVPVTHALYSRNDGLYLRRNQREGSGYLYDWVIVSENAVFDEDLFLLLSPIADRAGATERYSLAWGKIDTNRRVELQYRREDGSMCMRVRSTETDECQPLVRETLSAARAPSAAPEAGSPFWRELLVRSAHAQGVSITDPQFLANLLRSPDVFERLDARTALIEDGALPTLDALVAIDPDSYRINLAVLAALNAWEVTDADAVPDSVMEQAARWLTWPDAALRREAVTALARALSPRQATGVLDEAAKLAGRPPADTALSIAASDLYTALARKALDQLVAAGEAPERMAALARQANALHARAFEALSPAGTDDETAATLAVQTRLDALGLQPGVVDGEAGPATRAAIEQFAAETGLAPPLEMAALEPVLLGAQRVEALQMWRRTLATLAELEALPRGELDALDVRWSIHGRRLIDESPADHRDAFAELVEKIGEGGFVDDPTALYADALQAVLAEDWPRALESLQLVQRFDGDFPDAAAIELLIRRNQDVFAKDETAVTFAIGQILWCYDAQMPDAVRDAFKSWADTAGVDGARCSY